MSMPAETSQQIPDVQGWHQYRFRLPFRTEHELREFARLAWGLYLPDKKVCPTHTTPWRAFADAYFAKHPVAVWKGSRGLAGKTHLLSALSLTEAVALNADVNLLGGSGAQSARVLESTTQFWAHPSAPRGLLATAPGQTRTRLVPRNGDRGARIVALMASQTSVRGPHPQRLRLDEIDEMELPILDAALGQPMEARGVRQQVVMSSTHQYADGTMTAILRRAAEKGWPVYEWCYRETLEPHGWLPVSQIEATRATVTQAMWDVEYELQEPNPGSRAINTDAVAWMFNREIGEYDGFPGEYLEIEAPVRGAHYGTGVDWARDKDWTIILTIRFDTTPFRVVAFERRGREPYPLMRARFEERLRRYPGGACHDTTGGEGKAMDDELRGEAEAVILAGRTRSEILYEYVAAIERKEIAAPFIAHMEAEHRLASREDVFGGGTGSKHLPDTICAGALAYRAAGLGYAPAVW